MRHSAMLEIMRVIIEVLFQRIQMPIMQGLKSTSRIQERAVLQARWTSLGNGETMLTT